MNTPKLRFNTFSDNWTFSKLSDLVTYTKGFAFKSIDYQNEGYRIIRVSDLLADSINENNEKIFINKDQSNAVEKYRINPGDIIVTTVGSKPELINSAVGRTIFYNTLDINFLNQNLIKLCANDTSNSYFIYQNTKMKRYTNHIENIQRGNANQSNITVKELLEYGIYTPSLSEQNKIADFFKALNKKIQLQQEKIDLLKEQKKGFMQKIFSQELRFNNFCNKWEITKVSKVATLVNGRAYKKEELLDQGKYRVLRVGNFFTNDSWYFSDLELDSDKYANKEDLLYAWSASFGPKIWKEEKVIYHYHIWKVIPNDKKVLRDFLYHWFTFDKTRILSQKNGSTLVHITKGGLEETNIEIPCLDEQKAISDFLNILESKISLAEDKFAILNQQKQAFMQQMFI